jgi:hypothetical protein
LQRHQGGLRLGCWRSSILNEKAKWEAASIDVVRDMFAKIAVSVAVGFLGAYPLASSSGLLGAAYFHDDSSQNSLIMSSGIILFFLTLTLIGPTLRLARQILDTLGRVEERPRPPVALMMLFLGTFCAISAMIIQLNAENRPPSSISMNIPGFNAGNNPGLNPSPGMAIQPSGTLGLGILTILTFLFGTALIGLGIWASLKPSATVTARMVKPEARELQEVAT